MSWEIKQGDCLDILRTMQDKTVHCCVTSPPYWGLRDYGVPGQLGLEPTPEEYVAKMVEVFREVRRVLRDEGTLWLNLGDSYASGKPKDCTKPDLMWSNGQSRLVPGYKHKDLIGIPWRVAFALQTDGWYLRSDIIWSKPNPMPESVTDRPTKAHEYIFLLTKSERYFYDAEAIKEPAVTHLRDKRYGPESTGRNRDDEPWNQQGTLRPHKGFKNLDTTSGRNKRTVWTVATQPFPGAHFATFPPKLIEPCILAGCPAEGIVLDPFNGAGTTGMVVLRHGRKYIGIELNPEYVEMSRRRIEDDAPLFNMLSS